MKNKTKVSVIIPAYNEEMTLSCVVKKVFESLKGECRFEVIVVDDGSLDNTFKVANNSGALVIRHNRNMGQGAALKSGLKLASGDIVVMLDADGQHDPAEIPKLIDPILRNEADLVIGSRYLGGNSGFGPIRELLDKLFLFFIRILTNSKLTDSQSMFRGIRREVFKNISLHADYTISGELIIKAKKMGLRITEVPIHVSRRIHGRSYVNIYYPIHVIFTMLRSAAE